MQADGSPNLPGRSNMQAHRKGCKLNPFPGLSQATINVIFARARLFLMLTPLFLTKLPWPQRQAKSSGLQLQAHSDSVGLFEKKSMTMA